jgi:ribonuclease BN (tRNA processing enzyme)
MQVTFLGVGEACDERLPNTSIWLESGEGSSRRFILLDCGFTVPPLYWRECSDPDDLDGVWISHFHGDHFFGLPALLLRFWEQKRSRPLAVVGQAGIEEKVCQAMELAYPGFMARLEYPLHFHVAATGAEFSAAGLSWKACASSHGQANFSVRVSDGECSVFYSGDGMPTEGTLDLALGCRLMIHEAFRLDQPTPGHGTVTQCIDFARRAGVPSLALVHLQRDERRDRYAEIVNVIKHCLDPEVYLPEPGDILTVC